MGFEGEFASYEPLRRLRESVKVQVFEKNIRIHDSRAEKESISNLLCEVRELPPGPIQPDLVLAFDGGEVVKAENGFPEAELGYITVASVLIDLKKVNEMKAHDFISPKEFRTTEMVELATSKYTRRFESKTDYGTLLDKVFRKIAQVMKKNCTVFVRTDVREFTLEMTIKALTTNIFQSTPLRNEKVSSKGKAERNFSITFRRGRR